MEKIMTKVKLNGFQLNYLFNKEIIDMTDMSFPAFRTSSTTFNISLVSDEDGWLFELPVSEWQDSLDNN
jgi:hypothetical protein